MTKESLEAKLVAQEAFSKAVRSNSLYTRELAALDAARYVDGEFDEAELERRLNYKGTFR